MTEQLQKPFDILKKAVGQRKDTELLDFLERLNNEATFTGRCKLRVSVTDRGWRLMETNDNGTSDTVRGAINAFMDEQGF